jgi:hypothetical protein
VAQSDEAKKLGKCGDWLKYCLIGVAGFFGLWLSVAILKFFLWNHFGHVFMTMLFAILAASGLAEDKKFGLDDFASSGVTVQGMNLMTLQAKRVKEFFGEHDLNFSKLDLNMDNLG